MLRYGGLVRVALVCTACALTSGARGAAPEAPVANAPANPLWTIPLNALTATRERPLFAPSRRPAMQAMPAVISAAPPPPAPPPEAEQLSLRLLGTIAGPDSGIAICLNPATGEAMRLRTGESHEGWTLRAVRGREAAFEKASRRTVLTLPSPDDPAQPAPQVIGARDVPLSPVNAVAAQPAPAGGTWRDGDGNLIAPPPKR